LFATGCKQGGSLSLNAGTNPANLSGDAGDTSDAGATSDAGGGSSGGINLCGQLSLDTVRIVVRRINLEVVPSDGGTSDAGTAFCDCDKEKDDDRVCAKDDDVHVGPFLVDLEGSDLSGGIHHVFDVNIPSGTYQDVRFEINTLSRHMATDGGLVEMKDLHASIAANGRFNDQPFQFTTSIHLKQKQEGPFTVGDGTKSITLNVDPSGWFVGANGQVLDPNDPRNRGQILENIRCSVRMSSDVQQADGGQMKRDFDDDDGEDRCGDADDDHGGDEKGGDHQGGQCGNDDHDHGKFCAAPPALDCGDAGTPVPDAGTSADAGTDAGM
jgi:hypothetical protein